jgi:hypothetical protein
VSLKKTKILSNKPSLFPVGCKKTGLLDKELRFVKITRFICLNEQTTCHTHGIFPFYCNVLQNEINYCKQIKCIAGGHWHSGNRFQDF